MTVFAASSAELEHPGFVPLIKARAIPVMVYLGRQLLQYTSWARVEDTKPLGKYSRRQHALADDDNMQGLRLCEVRSRL